MAITKVTNSLVAVNAIQGTLIADNAITSVHIAQNQVTAVQIPDGSITSTQIAANSIDTAELVTGSIDTIHIGDSQVTTAKIADLNVTTGKIANNAITAAKIPDGSITATQLDSSTAPTFGNITTTGSLRGPASFTIDPAAVGDNTGTVVIAGSLQVDGTTTTVNSTTLSVADKNIVIASGAADAAAANDAGITVTGASATLLYKSSGDKWSFNKPLDITGDIDASGLLKVGVNDTEYANNYLRFKSTGAAYIDHSTTSQDINFRVSNSSALDTTPLVIKADGKIGIGTSGPDGELHVLGTGGGNGDIYVERTSGAKIHLQAQSANGKIGTSSNHNLGLNTNGTTRVTIDTNGKVGIGEISPLGKLHIKEDDSGVSSVNSNFDQLVLEDDLHSGMTILSGTSGDGAIYFGDSGSNDIGQIKYKHSSNSLDLTTSGQTRLTIDSSGFVHIGTTDANHKGLSIKYHAANDSYTPNTFNDFSLLRLSVANAQGNYAGITYTHAGGTEFFTGLVRVGATADITDYVFQGYNGNSNAYQEYMRINSSGQVKIGNTGGSGILNVDNGSTDGGYVHFANNVGSTTLTNDKGLAFGWNKSNGGGESLIIANQGAGSTGGLVFATNTSGGSYAEKMRITSSGGLEVGDGTNYGYVKVINDSAVVQYLDRRGSDGIVLEIRHADSKDGQINTLSGRMAIGSDDTGVFFDSTRDCISPFSMTQNDGRANAIDIGRTGVKFRHLWISGGLYGGSEVQLSNLGLGTVEASASVGHTASENEGVFWHSSKNDYAIYRTSGAWSGNYSQLKLDWDTGIILDGGTSYGKSGVHIHGNISMGDSTYSNFTSPNYPVHICADGYSLNIESGTGYSHFGSNNTTYFHIVGDRYYYFGQRCEASGGFHTYSDENLKKEITPITGALDDVAKMNGVTFKWKDAEKRGGGDAGKQFGVTAQNMLTVDSELPTKNVDPLYNIEDGVSADDEYYTMDYSRITPFLIEAVKELKTKLEAAEARITELEG